MDIFINNAGISFDGESVAGIKSESANQVLDISLLGSSTDGLVLPLSEYVSR